jgi:hypothetical protein
MSEQDKDEVRRRADEDQKVAEGLSAMARMTYTFYTETMQSGFSPPQAFHLAAIWLTAMIMHGKREQ